MQYNELGLTNKFSKRVLKISNSNSGAQSYEYVGLGLQYLTEKNIKTLLRVNETLKKMTGEKQVITFSKVAKQAQVSRAWLYKNDKIKNQIEAIREEQGKKTPVDLIAKDQADQITIVENLKQRIKKLQQENSRLREQIEVIYGKMLEK